MLRIDAINDMLSYLGESPLDVTDPDYANHPLYQSALRVLNRSSSKVQSRGWWFNDRVTDLIPVANSITIPATYLTVRIVGYRNAEYTIRNGVLFDMTNNTAVIGSNLRARIVELVDFEDLPETAAEYIAAHAASRFVRTYDGDAGKQREVEKDEQTAYGLFNSDEIKNRGVNLYHTASMGPVLGNNWYTRYRLRA